MKSNLGFCFWSVLALALALGLAQACGDDDDDDSTTVQAGAGVGGQAGSGPAAGSGAAAGMAGGGAGTAGGGAGSAGSAGSSAGDGGASGKGEPPEISEQVSSSKARLLSPDVSEPEADALKQGNTAFAVDLYRVLSNEAGDGDNLFFSPHSISVALAMTYAGARNNTEAQMASALHFTLEQERLHEAFNRLDLELDARSEPMEGQQAGFRLNIVNAIWPQKDYTFLPDFLDVLAVHYGAALYLLDFVADPEGSRLIINGWVAEQTEDRIEDLIPQGIINGDTRLVLTNAIYFNAAWEDPFETSDTADGTFTLPDGSGVTVPMMNQTAMMQYAEGSGWKAVQLPYERPELGMAVILPDDLDAFESAIDASTLLGIVDQLRSAQVTIRMPRFTFESEFTLNEALKSLGMTDAFSGAADFSGMNGRLGLFIQAVVHKAFIDVNEAGTEAAAATAVIMGETAVPQIEEITLDRPFLFLIWDRPTGAILFLGRVVDPS